MGNDGYCKSNARYAATCVLCLNFPDSIYTLAFLLLQLELDTSKQFFICSDTNTTSQMNYRLYRGHSIVASGTLHELTGRYYPVASISWERKDGTRGVHIISNSPEQCVNWDVACNLAIELAKAWIDRRLRLELVSAD
jgi:hypothetical protein